jgi:hypothetical protein
LESSWNTSVQKTRKKQGYNINFELMEMILEDRKWMTLAEDLIWWKSFFEPLISVTTDKVSYDKYIGY